VLAAQLKRIQAIVNENNGASTFKLSIIKPTNITY